MGINQSQLTADGLWKKENAKKGLQIMGAAGSAVLLSPVVMLALPIVGAYEFSKALDDELITGHNIVDGLIGGLFGVVVSPLAPFYYFLTSIRTIFGYKRELINEEYLQRAEGMLRLNASYYNVAVVGSPGTGKSSLVNAMLGYQHHHPKAAAVGEAETTMEPKAYRHPLLPALALWDMPGIGTPRHPHKDYFENYCLGAFDALLVVFDDRFMATDVDLARKAARYNVPVFFIKNKADLSIERKIQRLKTRQLSDTEKWAQAVSDLVLEVR
ncbi:hypothetical protein CU097_014456 [Rhizopus azygosporus]|uniref:IRG-type G domain-containing protein n=3 Tax=Rhizopus TaxID=4842 RepID=A0A367K8Y6_RHIAZ|nr:hypothetical protein CU097_014456 [Rhizopus azygosporus]